jgi:hypothetical protein
LESRRNSALTSLPRGTKILLDYFVGGALIACFCHDFQGVVCCVRELFLRGSSDLGMRGEMAAGIAGV